MEEKWIRMIGFRNILVHDYLVIDRQAVYDVLQNNLDDFEEIKKSFAKFLQSGISKINRALTP
jgi:uncharacterized protein YutE (UPF0331/DUF86 family)